MHVSRSTHYATTEDITLVREHDLTQSDSVGTLAPAVMNVKPLLLLVKPTSSLSTHRRPAHFRIFGFQIKNNWYN